MNDVNVVFSATGREQAALLWVGADASLYQAVFLQRERLAERGVTARDTRDEEQAGGTVL